MEVARAWCWGAGWDSSAGIILDIQQGKRIDLITFADHGTEKREPDRSNGEEVGTYEFVDFFSEFVVSKGYPRPVVCRYEPKPETHARYRQSVEDLVEEMQLPNIDELDIDRLSGLYGNALANQTLPGLAYNMKSCSIKWKLQAQEPI